MALFRCSAGGGGSAPEASGYEDFDGVSSVTIPLTFQPKMVLVICRSGTSNILIDLWTPEVVLPISSVVNTDATSFMELTQTQNGGSRSFYKTSLGSGVRGLVDISSSSPYSITITKPTGFGNVAYWYAAG